MFAHVGLLLILGLTNDISLAHGNKGRAQVPHAAAAGAVTCPRPAAKPWVTPHHCLASVSSPCCLQVAINWCICKGAVPIPGAKSARQAQESAGKCLAVLQVCHSLGSATSHQQRLTSMRVVFEIGVGGFGWRMSDDQVLALERETDKISGFVGAPFENW